MGANSVDTEQIFDGSITGAKVATGTLTSDKLAQGILTNGTRCGMITATISTYRAGTIPIGTIPAGSLITDAIAFARVGFDGDTAITVGITAAQTSLFTSLTLTANTVTGETASRYGVDLCHPDGHS